ncbi:hypothetical protein GCM10020358_40090 [Amorphoplanes nipponensis]|uniref:Secreted protein n=1 Tax=Actinoplanes nipponensis TaxID=135950 RepID=A0A919MQJ1_9ACTN|nr:hypothetical protein [Actinoplanes nipponensis]GIE53706.1 hypothetical protein Ani05nite_72400 [Actinoplanes nipponensis]
MDARFSRLVVAGAVLAAGLGGGAPASAAVTYDPEAHTGFVGAADVRRAFGWTPATLTARAGRLAFDHDFWTDDTYSAVCGGRTYPLVHHREFGRYELTEAVVRRDRPRSSTGYGDGVTGFRLTGASSGISGTSVGPAVGRPCPADLGAAPGSTIVKLRLVSSATGWALAVSSGQVRRELVTSR